jgi:hypothetical protein
MNPELRLEELNKTMAELQAEIAQAKADIAAAKAVPEPNIQDTAVNIDGGRGLQGNRDAEGSMITAKQIAIPEDLPEDEFDVPNTSETDLGAWYRVMVKQAGEDWQDNPAYAEAADFFNNEIATTSTEKLIDMGIPVQAAKVTNAQLEDEPTNVPEDSHEMDDGSIMQDSEMEAVESVERTMGMTQDEGGTSSVDTKDDFWKTQEGYDKAMEMYGNKPAWVKEPTLVWNPSEQNYEKIKEEDKEQYEDLGISADIKQLFG